MEKKKFILLLISLVIVIAVAAVLYPALSETFSSKDQGQQTEIEEASDFTVYDTDGNAVSLSDQQGKPVVVNFWATWCGYCINELPYFNDLYKEYEDSVTFMMVDLTDGSSETPEGSMEFIEEEGYSFPVYFDNDQSASNAYALSSVPVTLFIDSEGNILYTQLGAMDKDTLEENINSLLDGSFGQEETTEKESKCSFH